MRLTQKLFMSYLLVGMTVISILTIITFIVVPADFSDRMGMGSRDSDRSSMQMGMMASHFEELDAVRGAVTRGLMLAGLIAVVLAALVSWFISRRIVKPIQGLVDMSRHISAGHYDKRLTVSSNDELGDLITSFNQMTATLEETEMMRRQLLGDITHELKTPLSSIKGYMEGLQDNILPADPETFQLIHKEATRLQRLVNDLQQLSRIEAGQIPVELKKCEPVKLVKSTVEKLKPQFSEKNIRLVVEHENKLPDVVADAERTEQVLINLVGNALQYTPSGGEVRIIVKLDGASVIFSVKDTGIGIEANDLERIFNRFYRVDKSRARSSGGSGIGLTISRHLVELQGGRMWAESSGVNFGSTFTFLLPSA